MFLGLKKVQKMKKMKKKTEKSFYVCNVTAHKEPFLSFSNIT